MHRAGYRRDPGGVAALHPKETEDNYDAIEWVAIQPFSTGKVGQWEDELRRDFRRTGWQRCARRTTHLVATAPFVSYQSGYHQIVFPGGIHKSDFDSWAPFTAGTAAPGQDAEAQGRMMGRGLELNEKYRQHPLYEDYRGTAGRPTPSIGSWARSYGPHRSSTGAAASC